MARIAFLVILLASAIAAAQSLPDPAPPATDTPVPVPEPATVSDPGDPDGSTTTPDKKKKKKKKKKKGPKFSGFVQFFYRYSVETSTDGAVDAPNFRTQRVRLAVEGNIKKWLGYDISVDPRAPEITGVLRDAYLTIKKVVPYHKIRIGQQKTLFGYENVESSTRLFAVNRTELSDNLSRGVNLRDVGLGFLGDVPLGGGFSFQDQGNVVNGNGLNSQIDDTRRKSYWGRVGGRWANDDTFIRLGVSGGHGDYIDPADPLDPVPMEVHVAFERIGTDLEVDTKWAFLSAEYVWGRDKLPTETTDEKGYYVNLVGKAPYKTGPIFRYDVLGDEFQRFTFGGYYGDARDKLRFLVNYEYRRLKDAVRGDDRLFLWTQVKF